MVKKYLYQHILGVTADNKDIETKSAGRISNQGIYAPDVYLKAYGT